LCEISALHLQAVQHLQNAKLPLYGYKAWPLGNTRCCWPPPDQLRRLLQEIRSGVEMEREYMTIIPNGCAVAMNRDSSADIRPE
ncbi:MAG: hypothetical protein WCP55_04495, partial [Lentisphaerota bacterium]